MTKIDGGIGCGGICCGGIDDLLFTNVCVSEITAIYMSLTKEDIIKCLKEVTRKLEEGDEIDSSTMGIVEKFLKNFPPAGCAVKF